MSQSPATSYEFGPFQLDVEEQILRHDGQEMSLAPKAFGVLLLLVRNPGHVLTKDDFLREVWAGSVVEENNLTDNISILRHALGDDPRDPKYIKTVPRRGYRFVGEVKTPGSAVELLLAEHTRARVVIEQEDFSSKTPARLNTKYNRRLAVTVLTGSICVLAVLSGGFVWYRHNRRSVALANHTDPHLTPLTSFPDEELNPALSPDGKFVAYSWKGGTSDRMNLYVQQTDAGTPVRLTAGPGRDGSPSWSPDGRFIAFTRGSPELEKNGIYIIPAFGGHERLLTNQACGADWSPDGKSMVVISSSNPKVEKNALCAFPLGLSILNIETLETRRITTPPADDTGDIFARYSPDGKSVAFVRSHEVASELFVVSSEGGEARQLTFDKRRISGVAWTEDGKEVVFSSNRSGSYGLWRISAEGGTAVLAEGAGQDAQEPFISRSGGRLVYSQQAVDTNIWQVSVQKAGVQPIKLISSSRRDEHPNLSTDGKRIAFESNRSGSREIWTCAVDGTGQSQVTSFNGPYTTNAHWSPDGQKIAIDSRPEGHPHIYVFSADGGSPIQLTQGESNELSPSWSRDGKSIYFASNRGGTWQVWRVPASGGESTQITRDGGYEAVESPDGRSLYYTKAGYLTNGLFQSALDGSSEKLVLDLPQLDSFGDWTVTAKGIYYIHRYDGLGKLANPIDIRFFDFNSRSTKSVASLEHDPTSNPGLNISPDGQWLFYSIDDYRSFDIMLVNNFR